MKLLHISDIHANDSWFAWLETVSSKFGLICLTGDLLDINTHRPMAGQVDRVITRLRKIKTPMLVSSGNHDMVEGQGPRLVGAAWLQELRRPGVWVDGDTCEYFGFRFHCIPWNGQLPEACPNEVWLTHVPPEGATTSIAKGGAGFGSFELSELCHTHNGPRLALSGHVHDPQSWKAKVRRTWSLNPGCQERALVPPHNVIDLNRGVATHLGADGASDIVRLW
jgi:Icc-related predicted phosphoesterase